MCRLMIIVLLLSPTSKFSRAEVLRVCREDGFMCNTTEIGCSDGLVIKINAMLSNTKYCSLDLYLSDRPAFKHCCCYKIIDLFNDGDTVQIPYWNNKMVNLRTNCDNKTSCYVYDHLPPFMVTTSIVYSCTEIADVTKRNTSYVKNTTGGNHEVAVDYRYIVAAGIGGVVSVVVVIVIVLAILSRRYTCIRKMASDEVIELAPTTEDRVYAVPCDVNPQPEDGDMGAAQDEAQYEELQGERHQQQTAIYTDIMTNEYEEPDCILTTAVPSTSKDQVSPGSRSKNVKGHQLNVRY